MTDVERRATTVADGLRTTLGRLGHLILAVTLLVAVVCLATFATGWWVFDGSSGWIVIGGLICGIPVFAALRGWWYVRATAATASGLLGDVKGFLSESRSTSSTLIDYDSGEALTVTARNFGSVREELETRRTDFPALYAGVRAVTRVPVLAAIAVLGMLGVGALGTVLLLVGLIG